MGREIQFRAAELSCGSEKYFFNPARRRHRHHHHRHSGSFNFSLFQSNLSRDGRKKTNYDRGHFGPWMEPRFHQFFKNVEEEEDYCRTLYRCRAAAVMQIVIEWTKEANSNCL